MSIFDIAYLTVLFAFVVIAAKALSHLFGISSWVFAVPLAVVAVLAFRRLGLWLAGRRQRRRWPVEGVAKRGED